MFIIDVFVLNFQSYVSITSLNKSYALLIVISKSNQLNVFFFISKIS